MFATEHRPLGLDDLAFFQAVRSVLAKRTPGDARPEEELDLAVRQIVSRAVASEGVVDLPFPACPAGSRAFGGLA
jgi:hypothetical protein